MSPAGPLRRVIERDLWLPRPPSEVFAFFADAGNLDVITPPWLHFRILTPAPIDMRAGATIDYRLRLRGLPIRWRTRISAWEPPSRFVDEQERGPYRAWVHEHSFEPETRAGVRGTRCRDRVGYDHAGGVWIERWLVRPDLERIFDFRADALRARFADGPNPTAPAPSPPRR